VIGARTAPVGGGGNRFVTTLLSLGKRKKKKLPKEAELQSSKNGHSGCRPNSERSTIPECSGENSKLKAEGAYRQQEVGGERPQSVDDQKNGVPEKKKKEVHVAKEKTENVWQEGVPINHPFRKSRLQEKKKNT